MKLKTRKIDKKLTRYYTNLERAGLLCSKHGTPTWEHPADVDWSKGYDQYTYQDECLQRMGIYPGWMGYTAIPEGGRSITGLYNTFLIDGIWVYAGRDNAKYMYLFDNEGGMMLEKDSSLIRPRPKVIDTIGDVYNYCVGKGEEDVLPFITKYNTYRRMKQTALVRIMNPKRR